MKRRARILAAAVLLPSFAAGLGVWAQYAVDWYTIDGGGGTSTGGVYSVSGTIGQPDANEAVIAGGAFELSSGFWSVIAVQTPGAPWLSIAPAGPGQVSISWTPDTTGWVLQETGSPTVPGWTNSPSISTNPIVVPGTLPVMYYRLFKP